MHLDPRSRLVAVVASLAGIIASQSLWLLAGFLGLVWGMLAWQGQFSSAVRGVGRVGLSIAPLLFVVWGGLAPGESRTAGLHYAAVMSLKVVAIASLALTAFGGLSANQLAQQLKGWGLGNQAIAAALGALTVWPEMRMRAVHIIEARYARGLLPKRAIWRSALALPFILRPLLTWSLRSAILRAEAWDRRGILARINEWPVATGSRLSGGMVAFVTLAWATLALWMRAAP